jgi:hypothetical protein
MDLHFQIARKTGDQRMQAIDRHLRIVAADYADADVQDGFMNHNQSVLVRLINAGDFSRRGT